MTDPTIKPLTADDIKIQDMTETIDRTKRIMVDNIDQLLQRGEKLEQLLDKTAQTEEKAQIFTQQARQIQIKARFENIAMTAAMIGFILGGFYGLSAGIGLPMVAICGGIGGVVFYSVVWMFSGAIQSILKLPFFNLGFSPNIEKIEDESISVTKNFHPSLDYVKPNLIYSNKHTVRCQLPAVSQAIDLEAQSMKKLTSRL
ncbi:hypothetical protein CC99x_000965 [Candidatus Berkiella cookevillensis]|uniref:Synaptobrevin n=1 Tax=Candidatus Berkiella cookevillensis TaxID=437022 RepID=A0A0Q9YRP1_9GAMM|nr:synaptobrevin family protein [Candidatus Berkiella cookevillensis]MCS5707466.1 hypothetical protein [Candidatus Berkiella cookevillensis]